MRFHLVIFSLALIQTAFVAGEDNLLNDGLHEPFDEWTTLPDPSTDPESLLWNLDDEQLTPDNNFNLASSSTDFWASCSPGGLGARDEQRSCPATPKKDEVPTLPTFRDLENAVGNTPSSEPEEDPLRENQILQFYRADSKCPPTNPHHLCCICDDAFAFEVCQDCFLCK